MRPRPGFTLIELLVAAVLMGILFALLVPAVQKVRAAATRVQCMNNLHQLGLAVHNYEAEHGALPGAGTPEDRAFSVHARLLPYLEQGPTYRKIDFTQPLLVGPAGAQTLHPAQRDAAQKPLAIFRCPDDNFPRLFTGYDGTPQAGTNYVVNYGTGTGSFYDDRYPNDGLFWMGSRVRWVEVRDGQSATLLMTEALLGSGLIGTATPLTAPRSMADASALAELNPDGPGTKPPLTPPLCATATAARGDRAASWLVGRLHRTGFNTFLPINSGTSDCYCHGPGYYAARSAHVGGLNALLADGAVRFISTSLPLATWQALSTRSGGDAIEEF